MTTLTYFLSSKTKLASLYCLIQCLWSIESREYKVKILTEDKRVVIKDYSN